MPKDLRTFIDDVLREMPGSIKLVNEPVDPRFGITAVPARLAQQNEYPAVMYTQVKGSTLPSIINLTATYERLALALGTTTREMVQVYGNRQGNPVEPVVLDHRDAPVQEVIWQGDQVDLRKLPISVHNERDSNPYITSGILVTKDPDSGALNAGLYRHEVQSKNELGVWFWDDHHGAYIQRRYEELNQDMEVAIIIGHHPAFVMGCVSRLQGFGGEYGEAGALLQEPLELVKGITVDLLVPARAELVIEGVIKPGKRRFEGPFAEWPGHYIAEGEKPYIEVQCITMRHDAIYYDVFACNREHTVLGSLPRMGSIFRQVQRVVPGVKAVNVPSHSRMHCYVSISKRRDAEVKKAAFAALNTEPDNLKLVIVVDDDIDVFNDGEVMWAVGTRFDATRDLVVIPDWSGPGGLLPGGWKFHEDGSKEPRMIGAMIIDATKPAPPVQYPVRAIVPKEAVEQVDLSAITDLNSLEQVLGESRQAS